MRITFDAVPYPRSPMYKGPNKSVASLRMNARVVRESDHDGETLCHIWLSPWQRAELARFEASYRDASITLNDNLAWAMDAHGVTHVWR